MLSQTKVTEYSWTLHVTKDWDEKAPFKVTPGPTIQTSEANDLLAYGFSRPYTPITHIYTAQNIYIYIYNTDIHKVK